VAQPGGKAPVRFEMIANSAEVGHIREPGARLSEAHSLREDQRAGAGRVDRRRKGGREATVVVVATVWGGEVVAYIRGTLSSRGAQAVPRRSRGRDLGHSRRRDSSPAARNDRLHPLVSASKHSPGRQRPNWFPSSGSAPSTR
jgi:hypothetical protein